MEPKQNKQIEHGPWLDEQKEKPALGQEVAVCIIRRAKRVQNNDGTLSWQLISAEPINLQEDIFFWQTVEEVQATEAK